MCAIYHSQHYIFIHEINWNVEYCSTGFLIYDHIISDNTKKSVNKHLPSRFKSNHSLLWNQIIFIYQKLLPCHNYILGIFECNPWPFNALRLLSWRNVLSNLKAWIFSSKNCNSTIHISRIDHLNKSSEP